MHIPEMCAAVRHPHIHLCVGISIPTAKAEDACFIIVRLKDTIDNRTKFQWNQVNSHAELRQIVGNQGGDFRALRVRGTYDDREFTNPAFAVEELPIAVPRKPRRS